MNFRKIIAVMAAVLMLCTIIPMSAISVSAADALYSWDFENGDLTGWASGSATHALVAAADLPVANPNGGSYAMSTVDTYYGYTNYDITLEKNTDYLLTFSILSGTKGYPLNVRGRLSGSDLFKNEITPSTTKWETYSIVFNSGDYTSIGLRFQHGWEGSTFYLDNITVEVYDPSNLGTTDGFINNGDFETGDASAWGSTSNTAVVADPTGAGQGYVMSTNVSESGVTMFSQTARNMKANTYYKLSFKVYGAAASGAKSAFLVRFPKTVTDWSVDVGSSGFSSQSANDYTPRINVNDVLNAWYDVSITFNTGDLTEVFINFMNYRASAGQYYFDDIKLTEMKTPSFDGYITNGDFETGDLTGWTMTAANIAEEDGNYVLQGTNATKYKNFVHQIVDVEANTEYAIRFKAKSGDSDGGQARVYAGTGTGNTGALNTTYSFTVKADTWGTYTTTFNSGENTQVYINLCQGITDGGDVYYDDVMMWEVKEASFDGYLYNGDFETGVGGTWKFSQSTAGVEAFAAYNGSFGANLQGNGGWGGLMSASFTTEAGATYQLTFWYKAISRGVNFSIKDTDNDGEKLKSGYYSKTEWTQVTLEFTALSATTYINFNGPGTEANGAEQVYVDDMVVTLIAPAHTCEIVELERVEADCENDGYVKYGCECGEGVYTETIEATGHAYAESARTEATCGADGSVTYTCGNCGDSYSDPIEATGEHSYDYDCDKNCAVCGNETRPEAAHEYFSDCETVCMICYEETREASHNVIHVEAKDATCVENGNIEYWYCDVCGAAWLDAECIQNTNLRAVVLAATGEHGYDNDFDVDCNVCGDVRDVVNPISYVGMSASEDVSGLAVKYDVAVEGLAVKAGTFVQADYTNATYNGYKLLEVGVVASNGKSEITIKGDRMYDLEDGNASFAFRIVNIPESGYETEITFTPYYVVEIDGVATTITGEAATGTYAEYIG